MSETGGLRRHPGQGGYARGEQTRARIVAAAVKVFGAEGYERASTRQIAAEAGVTPPALQYYFDAKEGLHRACAQFIIGRFDEKVGPAIREAVASAEGGGAAAAADALCAILDTMVELTLTSEDAAEWRQFMARGQTDEAGPAFPLLQEGIVRPLHQACAGLVAAALGGDADDPSIRLRTILLLTQMTALHMNSQNTLNILGWSDFCGDRMLLVKRVVRAHTMAALGRT